MSSEPSQPDVAVPDERFWVKYSPHQELPISSLASVAIHIAIGVGLLLLFSFVLSGSRHDSMPVDTLELGDNPNAGGGGDPNGSTAYNLPGQARVERTPENELPPNSPLPTVQLGGQPDIRVVLPDIPIRSDADRTLPDSSEAKNKLKQAGNEVGVRQGPSPSKGKGGPGTGGGQGAGTGPGTGGGVGPGTAGSIRQARNKRWTMTFSTAGGFDYLRQLSALGAVLVAEFPDGTRTRYRKLDVTPVPAEAIDQEIFVRMVWVDDRPGAVGELAEAMGLTQTPSAIRVYFPTKIESDLLRLELTYRGRKEEDIQSTVFRVFTQGRTYRIMVTEQRYN